MKITWKELLDQNHEVVRVAWIDNDRFPKYRITPHRTRNGKERWRIEQRLNPFGARVDVWSPIMQRRRNVRAKKGFDNTVRVFRHPDKAKAFVEAFVEARAALGSS